MKMTRYTYNLLLRLLAGIAASLILVGAVAMQGQRALKNIYRSASGIDPSQVVLTVDNRKITGEEYLYWLSYQCDYCSEYMSYMGLTDLNAEVESGYTLGDYIAQQAEANTLSMVTQYAVVDNWAAEMGITLTSADLADIQTQRAELVAQLGGEDAYQRWLQSLGISDSFITYSLSPTYLIKHLSEAYNDKNSSIYPSEDRVNEYLNSHDYYAARILFVDTCEMSEEEKTSVLTQMKDYADALGQSSDPDADFIEISENLGWDAEIKTFTADTMEEGFIAGLKEVDIDAVTGVITTEEGFYVAIRKQPVVEGVRNDMFNEEFVQRVTNADIKYNDEVYGAIDTLSFYQKLLASRKN